MDALVAALDPYVTAGVGLAGSLIGGAIAGTVSLRVAREARDAAERSWIRDSRRAQFDRLLSCGQTLLVACLARRSAPRDDAARAAVEAAHAEFFEAYGVVQTVAERPVVDAARVYGYRLLELKLELDSQGFLGLERFDSVAQLVRLARHDTIDAMRAELGLSGSARPPDRYNPFAGTALEAEYHERRFGRPA